MLFALGCSEYDLHEKIAPTMGADTAAPAPEDTWVPEEEPPAEDSGEPPTCGEFTSAVVADPAVDESCLREPTVGSFSPVIEWQWNTHPTYPAFIQIMSAPVVGNLNDDNGDGLVNEDDMPNVVFNTFQGGQYSSAGVITAIEGDGSGMLWTAKEPGGYPIYSSSGIAIGDLEGDGSPEVCVSGTTAAIICLNGADGTFKWAGGTETRPYGCPSIGDLDGDGLAEVMMGRTILDHTGALIATGGGGAGGSHGMSFPVDWDGDGQLELIAGNTVYERDGTIVWSDSRVDAAPAIGDFDLDGLPDLVRAGGGSVIVTMNDGSLLWESGMTGGGSGGPPTVADFDGDGLPEVGVADLSKYTVYDTDGTQLWANTVSDYSSSQTGSSVFDFEGDGAAEVVYADEHTLWIYDGATGAVKMEQAGHASGTLMEYPLIVDVDNDGTTEIVVASNNYRFTGWNGITIIGDADESWMESRPIWNQYAYHITNVENDGSIPRFQTPNWLSWNSFRAGGTEIGPSHWQSDLFPGVPQVCTDECWDDKISMYVPVLNQGRIDANDVSVHFIREDGISIRSDSLPLVQTGGVTYVGPVDFTREHWGEGSLSIVIDQADNIDECREHNNEQLVSQFPCDS